MDRTKKQRLKGMSGGTIDRKKAVGYCRDHKVALTTRTLKNHKCLSKQCDALKKYEDHPFWIEREQKKKAKKARKQALSGYGQNEKGDTKMKQGKVLLFPMFIAAGLCIVALIVGLVMMFVGKDASENPSNIIFDVVDEKQLEEIGYKKDMSGDYEFETEVFGLEGDMVVRVANEKVTSFCFISSSESTSVLSGEEAKRFTEEFVKAYSNELGFPIIEEPKLIQFEDDDNFKNCPEDKYEALANGYLLFEYSYRDAEGVLWIIQIYSPTPNEINGAINKFPDESGYAGFEPQVNLQKDVVK